MDQDNLYSSDDAGLLLQLSEGNKLAFDILYNKYWKQVYNAAYKRLNNKDHAQDVAQDVFVQLWIRGTKSPIANLPAYLFVAARNSVFKHIEKQGKYAAMPDMAEQLESPFERADSNILHKEFLIAFNQLIESLPPQQRVIFDMRFNDGLTSQQIADQLQISPKTVRNQMGRALATLRNSFMLLQVLFLLYHKR
jgi:RNA polymerase sigma-70 factor (family 1)